MDNFLFEIRSIVMIKISGEAGEVIGRAEYVTAENDYRVHYKCADGRAVTKWFSEEFLELV